MSTLSSLRRTFVAFLGLGVIVASAQVGCGSDADPSTFPPNTIDNDGDGGGTGVDPGPGNFDPDAQSSDDPDADSDALGTLVVTPSTATVDVSVVNGVINAAPVTFTASYNGKAVTATWLLDHGELGMIDGSGVFTASGTSVGESVVTARFGAREGTAKLSVVIHATQNGAPSKPPSSGLGGLGGVGGEVLGGPLSDDVVNALKTGGQAPTSEAELGFLYPYDKTVWPRGLLPPVLMWQTQYGSADAVYVKLSQSNYTFEGTYSLASKAGNARKRARLQEDAWETATRGNTGDDLKVEVKIRSGGKVYGPITESWKVAAGVLKGTVYYSSYDSTLTGGAGGGNGGVISIKPRAPNPVLAVQGQKGKCHVCHTLSADGSTLWAQDGYGGPDSSSADYVSSRYGNSASYDLTKTNKDRTAYTAYLGNLAVNKGNDHKFSWAAPYPDGSFALASSRYAREAYTGGNSALFRRGSGASVTTSGLSGVVNSAVTPAFSPDGRKVAFNFWTGSGAGGVSAGSGHSLAIMDFACGAAAGSTECAANGPFAFSGLREIYRNAARYPAWPSFLPDGKAVVFNNQVEGGACPDAPASADGTSVLNCQLTTWLGAKSELWLATDGGPAPRRLDAANGNSVANFPKSADHPDDTRVNYQPTVNPVASGGYYWVVFTSRRIYGNLLEGKPWADTNMGGTSQKKLWVAAIDVNDPGGTIDPSHPAFYLPGQEIGAGNTRAYWVVDPCKPNGTSCESGDECCNGFCRQDPGGEGLVCMDKPPGAQCVQEFEKCTVDADCCDPTLKCIANICMRVSKDPK